MITSPTPPTISHQGDAAGQPVVIAFPRVKAMMTGVSRVTFMGDIAELTYTDGTTESAEVSAQFSECARGHLAFQNGESNIEPEELNIFAVVSAVQDSRYKKVTPSKAKQILDVIAAAQKGK